MSGQRWKDLERMVARKLGPVRGERILRGDDHSASAPDIRIPYAPHAKIDCKSRERHAHHTLFSEIETKYCSEDHHFAVMVTRETSVVKNGQRKNVRDLPVLATVRLDVLVNLFALAYGPKKRVKKRG